MPSASSNISCANTSYKYTISVSWSESSPSVANNTSKITASGSMSAANVSFSANAVYNYYLRLYWHDNRTNTDTLFASSSAFHSCGMSFGSRSVSGSITVTHKDDGSLSGYVKMKFESPSTSGGWAPVTSWVQTANTALTTIARASDFTVNSYSNLGSAVNISISRKSTSFTHRVSYQFAGSSSTTVTTNAATSATFTPPLSLASQIPSATSGTLTISVSTWNGSTQVGSAKNKTVTLGVPSSVVPTMDNPTVTRVDNGVPSSWGVYVQGISKATVTMNSVAGAYGSWITAYSITGGGLNSGSSSATTGVLNNSGTVTFTCKITDSRGRSATKTASISVVEYSTPSIRVSAVRCDADGVEAGNGTYLKVTADYTIASVSSKNSVSSKSVVCNGVTNTSFSDATAFVLAANVSIGSTYILTAKVTDALGKSASANIDIRTAHRIMNVNKSKKGLAIGKFSEKDAFEVSLPSEFDDDVTMKNHLIAKKGHYIHYIGANSSLGIFKFARITVTGTYINTPIEMKLWRRGARQPSTITLMFNPTDNTDPSVQAFFLHGDRNLGCYIVKASASTWDLYADKSETWDTLTITDYATSFKYMAIEIEWLSEHVANVPSGYIAASFRGISPTTSNLYDQLNKQLMYTHNGSSWINARNVAAIRNNGSSGTSFAVVASQKTPSGSWEIGTIGEDLYFSYAKDSDLNAGNNSTRILRIYPSFKNHVQPVIDNGNIYEEYVVKSGTYKNATINVTYVKYGKIVTAFINWVGTADSNTWIHFTGLTIPEGYRPKYAVYCTVTHVTGTTVDGSMTRYVLGADGNFSVLTNSGAQFERQATITWCIV